MNRTLGDALQKALDEKKPDYSSFIWKGEKKKEGTKYVQGQKRIIDMDEEELQKCYNHCERMLNNEDSKNLGRYNILKEVNEQINKCNVELLLRYYENSHLQNENRGIIKRSPTLMLMLRQVMANNSEIEDWSLVPITQIADNLPPVFHSINIKDTLDGCIDYLGSFSKAHLTMTFLVKMGIWFTKAEENELKQYAASNVNKLKVVKDKLHLPSKPVLKINEKGLSYHEMRAMLTLPKKQKYSDMTTEQLITLRDKVLPRFLKEVDGHIFNWKRLQRQIILVAKSKGITLNND